MVTVVSSPVNPIEMVIDTVIKCPNTDPTDMSSATAVDMVAPIDLLDEDATIGTLLDIGMALRPPLQQQFLPAFRPNQRVLLTRQFAVGGLVAVRTSLDQTGGTLDDHRVLLRNAVDLSAVRCWAESVFVGSPLEVDPERVLEELREADRGDEPFDDG